MNSCDGVVDPVKSCVGDRVNRCVVGEMINCCDGVGGPVNHSVGDPLCCRWTDELLCWCR